MERNTRQLPSYNKGYSTKHASHTHGAYKFLKFLHTHLELHRPSSNMAAAATAATASSLLVVLLLMAALSWPSVVVLAADDDDGTTHLHFFMHDMLTGSNPTAVQVVKGPAAAGSSSIVPGMAFGDTTVIDDALTETSSPTSAAVGRAQGFYMLSSQSGLVLMVCANLVLTAGDHNGSTIAVVGRDDVAADVQELSVVGGTGKFRMATGYVLWKTSSLSGPDATIELDVYMRTATATTAIDGGGSITTGASSSAAAAPRVGAGWLSACVLAVVVAVVGSGVW